MKIHGAVLEEIARPGPWAETRPLTISELDLEPPGPHELLIKVEAAGVCHSDLSVVDGNRPRPVPMLLGHEASGTVLETGAEVANVRVGDRVVMTFLPRCGACDGCATQGRLPCSVGSAANNAGTLLDGSRLSRDGEPIHHHLGVSGFATHAVVDHRSVVVVDADVPADIAAVLGCAVLTGGGALINTGQPAPGDDIAIVGLGGVGMAALVTAVALGHGRVIGIDTEQAKLATARELGATDVFTPAEALEAGIKAPVVIEAAGHPRAFETALAVTAPGGSTTTVGLPSPTALAQISPLTLTAEARTVHGSYLGSAVPQRDIPLFVDMWRAGTLPVDQLISSRISLNDINEAMDTLAAGGAIRQVIVFDTPDAKEAHDA